MSRGLKNNNPGNIRNSVTAHWQGEVKTECKGDASFEEFESIDYGYRALIKLLQNYIRLHNCRTLKEIICRYAPPSENNTAGYVQRVCREMHVADNFMPDPSDKYVMCALAAAISLVENGVPAVKEDVEAGWNLLKE